MPNKNTDPRLKLYAKDNAPATAVINIAECFHLFGSNAKSNKHISSTHESMVIESTWHKLYSTRISLQKFLIFLYSG